MGILTDIEPSEVFKYFEEICSIPHGSHNTAGIADYLVAFAKEHNLYFIRDDHDNVIIKKDGTGSKDCPPVILQGHTDMVCEKEEGVDIDLEKDGLRLVVDGNKVKAEGTTLGADDGIAVAMILAVLDSKTLLHPPVEAVFTSDEEVGMLGATALDCSPLESKLLINLDSEDEGHILTSCAGGLRADVVFESDMEDHEGEVIELKLSGLMGGHSGQEIDKGRANADVVLARLLNSVKTFDYSLVSMTGGNKDNAIPRQAAAKLVIGAGVSFEELEAVLLENFGLIRNEYSFVENNMVLEIEKMGREALLSFSHEASVKIAGLICSLPNGVMEMSQAVKGLVQTSLNLGIMEVKAGRAELIYALRSSVESSMDFLYERILCIADAFSAKVSSFGRYQPMEYKADSKLRKLFMDVYKDMFGREMITDAIHAGVECGIFAGKIKDLDAVSIGPNLKDIHTPGETMYIDSVKRTWEYLVKVLSRLGKERI